ncbi:MAG: manganese efflux pump [Eubacteriales bacterium]|jgi:putative Mn2+ efflux pump MntP
MDFAFVLNSIALGVGLAMDAFCVSMANGLNEPHMSGRKRCGIAGCYAGFQFLMPMIGWICVHTIVTYFKAFQKFIPWIALFLLLYIGGKMLIEGIRDKGDGEEHDHVLTISELIIQGIATAIDALSVGFTISEYGALEAFVASLLIAVVTFFISYGGVLIGRKFGMKLAGKANILGGIILIAIGVEIFVRGIAG